MGGGNIAFSKAASSAGFRVGPAPLRGVSADEEEAHGVQRAILELLGQRGADSAVAVIALADVLAVTAATRDRLHGTRTLDDGMGAFVARVEQTYRRIRDMMESEALVLGERRGSNLPG
jgi:hypothetical protein